ncbi:MAG: ABC transporter permease subunit [Symploca sp. SIO1A3]|nr:ABC transporter permease subunit [Symploca sp. SIO1A3]
MNSKLLDKLGEWNPQLYRELKGKLKTRNLLITVAISLIIQLILLVFAYEQYSFYSQYSWEVVFRPLNWLLPFLLIICGVYQLCQDLAQEERRGTLNFIRLSPQSSQNILIGKILGVPALLYLGIALTVPLHLFSALATGMSLLWLLGIYTLWGAGCCLFYSAALFYTLLWNSQGDSKSIAGLGGLLAFFVSPSYISVIDFSFHWYQSSSPLKNWQWFFLPLGSEAFLAYAWIIITLSVATYWIWQAVNRRFRNPNATLLSKKHSYWLVACFQIWLLGFAVAEINSALSEAHLFAGLFFIFFLNPIWFLVLIAALTPHRQSLLDWARYRRYSSSSNRKSFWHRPLIQDLIWGEKSPVLVAVGINLLITAVIWIPWVLWIPEALLQQDNLTTLKAFFSVLLTMNLILLYGAINQLVLFLKTSKPELWATGVIGTVIALPFVISGILGVEVMQMPFLLMFSPFPMLALVNGSLTTVFFGLLAQLGVVGLLSLQLTKKLQKAGESESKGLLTSATS